MANSDQVIVSSDDTRWFTSTDFDGLEKFLATPRTWLSTNMRVTLAPSYLIQIETNAAQNRGNAEIDIIGTSSLIGGKSVTKTVMVRLHRRSVVRALRFKALREGNEALALPAASRWPAVTAGFTGKVTLDLTFRPEIDDTGDLDNGSGQIYPHFDLAVDQSLIAKYVVAIVSEPEKLHTWLNTLPVRKRNFWFAAGNNPPLQRTIGTKDVFNPVDDNINIMIEGDDAPVCPGGYIYVACSSDGGSYSGDPEGAANSHIDMEDITLKSYCIRQTGAGLDHADTLETRAAGIDFTKADYVGRKEGGCC